jgi:hypothetical protein
MEQVPKTTEAINVQLPDIDYLNALADAAKAYLAQGISVIPVYGDLRQGQESKHPAILWMRYQHELAIPADVDEWFLNRGYGGLAIVLGDISGGLRVLEFDNATIAQAYAEQNTDLLSTHTTLSAGKGLPHFRYRLPSGMPNRFKGKAGAVELRGEGQYVVVYPTHINEREYRIIRGGEALRVSVDQCERLFAFIDAWTIPPEVNTKPTKIIGSHNESGIVAYFKHQVIVQGSRSKALLAATCQIRDNGGRSIDAQTVLLPIFMEHPPVTDHPDESLKQRRREGVAIIRNVFKRKPRQPSNIFLSANVVAGLPTLAREALLDGGHSSLARLLDALYMLDWQPGQVFTERQAVEACKELGISRKTIRAALKHPLRLFMIMGSQAWL